MTRYVLDTDHISLQQRGNPRIQEHLSAIPPDQIAVTIVSFQEQVEGWLAQIRRGQNQVKVIRGYQWLQETIDYFAKMQVLLFDEVVAEQFRKLRGGGIRVGTQDLRIASIALTHNCIVVTRNRRDFERVPGLTVEDWSVEPHG